MIRGYLKHVWMRLWDILNIKLHLLDLDSLMLLRYEVISQMGQDQLRDVLRRMKAGDNYWEAVRNNHKEFFTKYYDSK